MTRYLVTGGSGYLGRHLVSRLLAAGREVRLFARPGSDLSGIDGAHVVHGDITDEAARRTALDGVSRVFHLAAETRDGQPAEVYEAVNHRALTGFLEQAAQVGVERFVHTSHYYAIGRSGEPRSAPDFVNDEYWTHDPGDMHDAHEQSKYDAENSVNQRVSLGQPVLALIPTMLYGPEAREPGERGRVSAGNRLVAMLAEHAAGRYPGIPGSGRQHWNLVHVEDVAAAHVKVMEAEDESGVWPPPRWTHWHYLCGGENVAVADLFARFAELTGVSAPGLLAPPRRGLLGRLLGSGSGPANPERYAIDSRCWAFSSEMAAADWGYTHRGLDQGLAQTVDWMRTWGLLG